MESVIQAKNIEKKYKNFRLAVPELTIPKGFATALIGENGAGKTTLINILAGTRLDYKGELCFFGEYNDADREKSESGVREAIGYTGPGCYFLPHWNIKQVGEVSELLFERFDPETYRRLLAELGLAADGNSGKGKRVSALSDGNRMKLMLAGVLARDTKLLILDEPASPLDPLMRDKLCEMLREYLADGGGERSVLFSTHNISDMENVTDYAVIMEHGAVVEQGFVEDLKEKYVLVKGEKEDAARARETLYSMTENRYGFEGICLAEKLDKLAGLDISTETPNLFQISVAVMRENTSLQFH